MQGNTPIRRCRPLPLSASHASAAMKDGFVPVTGVFGGTQCDDCCDNNQFSRRNNDCGCENDCCDNNQFSRRNNDCGCENDCCDNNQFSRRNNDCGCENDCCDNNQFSRRNNDCGCENDCCDNGQFSRRNNDCGCENDCCDNNQFSRRNNDCGCKNDCCDNNQFSRRNNDCGCENDCCDNGQYSGRNQDCNCKPAGMVYSADHCLKNRMNAAQGIKHGTLFTELHKPFAANPCPSGCANATNKQELAFAAWELRLYLNTHPDDKAALKLFEEYERRLGCANYATTFVPGCKGRNYWTWNSDPWPWEVRANSGKE